MIHSVLENIIDKRSPVLIVLVGPPLVGKSTLVDKLKDKVTVLSLDNIIREMHPDVSYRQAYKMTNWKKARSKFNMDFRTTKNRKDDIIVDMTNIRRKRRKSHITKTTDDYYKVAVVFPFIDSDTYTQRNSNLDPSDARGMSKEMYEEMMKNYQRVDLLEEGFDKVINL